LIFAFQTRELDAAATRETFTVPYQRNLNVISALMEIRKIRHEEGKQNHAAERNMSCLNGFAASAVSLTGACGRRVRRWTTALLASGGNVTGMSGHRTCAI